MPNAAPHSRIAFSSIASNTGARSPGEALMTCNTSAVAVCCSSASRCLGQQPRVLHRDHRLGGEILQQRDLLVGEGAHLETERTDQPSKAPSLRSGTQRPVRMSVRLDGAARHVLIGLQFLGLAIENVDEACAVNQSLRILPLGRNGWRAKCSVLLGKAMSRRRVNISVRRKSSRNRGRRRKELCAFPGSHRTPAQVAGRGVDHLQDLGGRGLLLQRLALSR